jgi:hypothetical protein
MAQKILQGALSSGFSAVSGIHKSGSSKQPDYVDPSYDGLQHVLPEDWIPRAQEIKYVLRGKYESVEVPLLSWGAWSWGDTATFHWRDDEMDNWIHAVSSLALRQRKVTNTDLVTFLVERSSLALRGGIHRHSSSLR